MSHPRIGRQLGERRSGAAAVEFAVIAPLLFAIVFGMIELGRAYMVQHLLDETARRACRKAVALQSAVVPSNYQPNNWNGHITDSVISPTLKANGITSQVNAFYVADGANVDISTATGATGVGAAYAPGTEITVKISVAANDVNWGISRYLVGKSLSAQYTLRKE